MSKIKMKFMIIVLKYIKMNVKGTHFSYECQELIEQINNTMEVY